MRKRSLINDPLASLSVHLAFERFDEAEELAKNAVEQYPERHEYRLRLLQVYHAVGNRVGFEYHAKALSAAVGSCSPMMAMVADWWRDLAPNEDLFTTPQSQVSSPDESIQQELGDDQEKPVVRQ
ncbi:MAG: tetratricopeptide repeat protein [Gammaproteobacteria bacterium]